MSEVQSFLDGVTTGAVPMAAIDEFVERWHQGDSKEELHEYLGMTREEYATWLADPDALAGICLSRRQSSLAEQRVRNVLIP